MYIKFGDPKSIIADFRFYKPKKCFKKGVLKMQKLKKNVFSKIQKSVFRINKSTHCVQISS